MPPKETIGSRNYKGTKKIRHGVDGGKNASERDNWELKLQRYKKYDMVLTAAKMPPKETIGSRNYKGTKKYDMVLTAAKMPPKETIESRNYKGTKKIRHGVDGGKNASERDDWELEEVVPKMGQN